MMRYQVQPMFYMQVESPTNYKGHSRTGYLTVHQHQERDGDQVIGRGKRWLLFFLLRTTITSAGCTRFQQMAVGEPRGTPPMLQQISPANEY